MPKNFLLNFAPSDSQLSSIKIIFFLLQKSLIFFISVESPKTLITKITLVFFDIFFIKSSAFTFKVKGLISTNFIFNPHCTSGHNDVGQHKDCIIASSPVLNLFFLMGLQDANAANKFAEDPELTINAYFEPRNLLNLFSKF